MTKKTLLLLLMLLIVGCRRPTPPTPVPQPPPPVVEPIPEPEPIHLPNLRTNGQFFELEDGTFWTAIGTTDFRLFARFLKGENIDPLLEQRRDVGFNILRVFATCDFLFHLYPQEIPNYYERLGEFLNYVEGFGLRVEVVALVDSRKVMPLLEDQLKHWNRVVEVLNGGPHLLELVNENDQTINNLQANAFPRPTGVVASHGSNGSQASPIEPFWTYATFHTNGASEEQRKIGHNAWEIWYGPTYTNEISRFPQVGMWVGQTLEKQTQLAFDSARGGALLAAGSLFHSLLGRNSEPFDEAHLEVAKAWVEGAKSIEDWCRWGSYYRADELLTSEMLRVYQRRLVDGRVCTAYIRR